MPGRIDCRVESGIGWIVFDHPERRNALSAEMWSGLAEAAARLGDDGAVRVVVMRGAGEEAFVSGADISEFQTPGAAAAPAPASGRQVARSPERGSGNAFHALADLDKPLIAAIHGHCIGGGLAVALCADMRYASDDASFAIPAARLGVGYDIGGVAELAAVVGLSCAKEILFSARRYSAAEAYEIGLVNRVVPKAGLDDFVREMAERIAANAPLSVRSVKVIARELSRERGERDMAAVSRALAACFESTDFAEGVRAFMEKRKPSFEGR